MQLLPEINLLLFGVNNSLKKLQQMPMKTITNAQGRYTVQTITYCIRDIYFD